MRPKLACLVLVLLSSPAYPSDTAAELVSRFGSPAFAEREAAGRKLRELGAKAIPAVTTGCRSVDAEVSRRCELLLSQLRADRRGLFANSFRADNGGKQTHEHPVWDRYVRLVGNSPSGRALFVEMIAEPVAFARLDDALADPARAARLYTEVVSETARGRAELMKVTFHVPNWPGDRPAELAAILFLGTCLNGDPWLAGTDVNASHLPVFVAGKPLQSPASGPIAKLFVAWLDKQTDGGIILSGLDLAFCYAMADSLPLARRFAADRKLPAATRAAALPILGRFGGAPDTSLCIPLLDDESVFCSFDTNGYLPRGNAVKKRSVEVRDVAAAVALTLKGANPMDFGFTSANKPAWREYLVSRYESYTTNTMRERQTGTSKSVPKEVLLWPPAHGFESEAERVAAHTKVQEWLSRQSK